MPLSVTNENKKDLENRKLFLDNNFDLLYEKNYPLLIYLAKKYNHHIEDYDEAISLANYCFAKAVKTYQPDKSNFSTYLGMMIKDHFSKDLRDSKAAKRNDSGYLFLSLQSEVKNDDKGKNLTLEEILQLDVINLEDEIIGKLSVHNFIDAVKNLPNGKQYQQILELRMHNCTQTEISKSVGVSQAHVSRHLLKLKQVWLDFKDSGGLIDSNVLQTYKRGETNMGKSKNPIDKLEEVIRLVQENVTEIEVVASTLGISKQLAKTYRFAALREIEKRKELAPKTQTNKKEQDIIITPSEIEPEKFVAEEDNEQNKVPEQQIIKKKEVVQKTTTTKEKKSSTISGTTQVSAISTNRASQKRLKPTAIVVASNDFEFKIISDFIYITMLNNNKTLALPKENLQSLIDDLKQVINYL